MNTVATAQEVWSRCISVIEQLVTVSEYNEWFKPLRVQSYENGILNIVVPSNYFVEKLEKDYKVQMTKAVRQAVDVNAQLCYLVPMAGEEMSIQANQRATGLLSGGYNVQPTPSDPYVGVMQRGARVDPQLNETYTFENYVVGEGNKLAKSVAEQVAINPGGTIYNPLFVYGGPGVGKTHLLQAIGTKAKEKRPDLTVVYLSADAFMRQYMEATRSNSQTAFVLFYQREVGLLIVDDIQELQGRGGTAAIFFQIFNHLVQNKKQVVLASDKKPGELITLDERLLSRFRAGIETQVKQPDDETRLKIVKLKAAAEGLSLPEDVAKYVAANISGNGRELQGAIISLVAYANLEHTDVNMELAQKVVSNLTGTQAARALTPDQIINAVCSYYGIQTDAIRQNTRKREIVLARQMSMYLCRKLTSESLSSIGSALGNKNHTTVVYACKSLEAQIETDENIATAAQKIEEMLK